MQDMHDIGDASDSGGRFIGVGDRRLRPPNHQALKCPRCDSLNTKFCYYNNYNLSQPRYFCKGCRRYWTKGGILRNVPVGGGCRKTKRSKAKSSASSAGDAPRESKSNCQSSSSESTSLTAATAKAAAPSSVAAEEGQAPRHTTASSTVLYNFPNARFSNVNPQANSEFDHQPLVNHTSTDGQIFPTDIGSFTSLMTSSEETIGFSMGDFPTASYGPEQPANQVQVAENPRADAVDELKMEDISNEGLAAALDWESGGGGGGCDHGLFDLTASIDQAYWNQSEWVDNDRSIR